MEQISNLCAILCGFCMFVAPVALVVWIVRAIKKSEKKKSAKRFFLSVLAGFVLFAVIGTATSPSTQCNHDWETIVQAAPTCTENGTSSLRCKICDTEGDETDIPAIGHVFIEKTVQEASCASGGIIEKTCSVCGEVESTTTEKLAHTYEVTATKTASLAAAGFEESTCSACGDVERKELEKLGTKENPGKVTIEQLVSEIKANKDAAKAKYNEQWIEITGKVLDASNVAGMTRFYLYGKSGDSGLRICCWVNEEILKPFEYQGEVHTFRGQVREITTFNATEIGDCQIISK